MVADVAPLHGTLTITTGTTTVAPGFPCAGTTIYPTVATYTWTGTGPEEGFDLFHLTYTGYNGSTAGGYWDATLITGINSKLLGDPKKSKCDCAGDPVQISSGNMFYTTTDYATAGQNPLAFTRYYNSRGPVGAATFATMLGTGWRSNFDRYIRIISSSSVAVERPDGQQVYFGGSGSSWTPDGDIDIKLTHSGSTWTLTDHDDTVETYTTNGAGTEALLNSIKSRNGYTQTLTYSGSNLASVSDSYGRTLTLSYSGANLTSVATPDSTTVSYGFTTSGSVTLLHTVSFPTSPVSTVTYQYGASSAPATALTSVVDENGNTYASWTYDAYSRATQSQLGSGANLTTFAYTDDGSNNRIVTNALGVQDYYVYYFTEGVFKPQNINRNSTSTTPFMSRTITYDANGYIDFISDWQLDNTTATNNSHGDPTSITEAYGTSVARTTTIAYDPTWVHLPHSITTPGLTTTFTYDANGELLTKTETDTTTTTTPYSTSGQARTWTNTWSNHLLASLKTPNGNTTLFGYNSAGALTSITNPLSQVTNITSSTGGGKPLTIVDPNGATNGMTTTLTYDARQRLLTSAVASSAGTHTTTYTYDATGNLTKTSYPDGSYIANTFDTAHRVTRLTNALGDYVAYTLDALGDRTQANTYASGGTLSRQHAATFDALGRKLTDTGGVSGEVTTYVYDNNGNVTSIKDGNNNLTLQAFDQLNRVKSTTNANSSSMTYAYDAHDGLLSMSDYNGGTTTWVRDGFEDAIQQTSPDSGTTIYRYDADANLTQWVPATGNGGNLTYDALDRITSKAFPSQSSQNIYYVYDQTGPYPYSANEIGRLSYITDPVGTLFFAYDGFGNVSHRERVDGSYTDINDIWPSYDAASRPSGIAYPSGIYVGWGRDAAGNINQVTLIPSGGSARTVEWPAHAPFYGPVTYEAFGNGAYDAITVDPDYRRTSSKLVTSSGNLSNQTYTYDNVSNLTAISDTAAAANSQTLGYDVLNRLTSAVSGTGGYGTLAFGYDSNGNLTSRTAGGTTYAYTYASLTNRLTGVTWPSNSETIGYTATGDINSMTLNGTAAFTGTYTILNRLSAVSNTPTAISSMVYDAYGLRFSKTVSGGNADTYVYDLQGNLIEENTGGTVKDYIYMDGKLSGIFLPASSALYYVTGDTRGAPVYITDSSQNVVWSTQYQPYGSTTPTGTLTNNIRLPGQYYDSETTLSYNGQRDYVPNWGRYLESDPIGLQGGENPYRYANASPLGFTDSQGLTPSPQCVATYTAAGAALGGILCGAIGIPTGPGAAATATGGAEAGGDLGLATGLFMCPSDSSKTPSAGGAGSQSTPAPPDDNDPQKKGRPASNTAQNKQVNDAANQAGLDEEQRYELGDAIEQASRQEGQNLGYQDILKIARAIKTGNY